MTKIPLYSQSRLNGAAQLMGRNRMLYKYIMIILLALFIVRL